MNETTNTLWRSVGGAPPRGGMPGGGAYPPEQDPEENDVFDLAEILQIAWANKWLLILAPIVGVCLAWWSVSQEIPQYTTSAEVKLKSQRPNIVDLQSVTPGFMPNYGYGGFNTELQVLTSSEVLGRVVDQLSLATDPEFNPSLRSAEAREPSGLIDQVFAVFSAETELPVTVLTPAQARQAAIGYLSSKVSASHIAESYVLSVRVTTSEPQKSADIANAVTENYVALQREKKFEALEDALSWLGGRILDLKTEVESSQEKIEDFVAVSGMVSPESVAILTQKLKSMRDLQAEHLETAEKLRQDVDQLSTLRETGDFAGLAERLKDPVAQRAASRAASAPSDSELVLRFDVLFEATLERARTSSALAQNRARELEPAISDLERQLEAQSADLMAFQELNRESEEARLIYDSFRTRYKEISVQKGMEEADSEVLSLAYVPGRPSHPNVEREVFQGGAMGLMLAIGLIFLLQVTRTTIRSTEELERLSGLPVLGVIPDHPRSRPKDILRLAVEKPQSSLIEAVRNLRTAIRLSNVDTPPRVVAITSSVPNEGKSLLAAILAITGSNDERKALLIDADLRRRSLSGYLEIEEKRGIVSVLSGEVGFDEAVQNDLLPNLDFLPSDKSTVHPVDLFESKRFAKLIADLRGRYELIVIDTPPVLLVPDTSQICQHVDAVIYSVRWNRSKRRMVRSGLAMLRQVHVHVSGVALTRIDPRQMKSYGYYGYGYRNRAMKDYYAN